VTFQPRVSSIEIANSLRRHWRKNTVHQESTLHQLAPYIGKLKSSIARGLILKFTNVGETVYDPYSGSGTVPTEASYLNRNVIANDLNPYAFLLTRAKLSAPNDLQTALRQIKIYHLQIKKDSKKVDLRKVPLWVRSFFHRETLREIIAWVKLLERKKEWFILACLLGILHHQRPGFLSFPASHTVPYLRIKKFPRKAFPELYAYRDVLSRLEKKVKRAFKRIPVASSIGTRHCSNVDVLRHRPSGSVDAIITSPPYMRSLDYGRDNRLRLWFLNCHEWQNLDDKISPSEKDFLQGFRKALIHWKIMLKDTGRCVLILGDSFCKSYQMDLPDAIEEMAVSEVRGYEVEFKMKNLIPNKRRVRRNLKGNKYETVLVLKKVPV
jgi:DNA modification methylase